ncbi:hypothetical protein [Nocardia sp. NPDC060249]|uniref:hypothetical protein n=1 Tax=Nocardia sp. NPDC060249 TaxID=3347082 RepID=UPI003652AF71
MISEWPDAVVLSGFQRRLESDDLAEFLGRRRAAHVRDRDGARVGRLLRQRRLRTADAPRSSPGQGRAQDRRLYRDLDRLYLATGIPYRKALKDYFNQEGNAKVWTLDYGYRAGDLILTAIQTSPWMFIALEVALTGGAEGTSIQVDGGRSVEFNNGILADAGCQARRDRSVRLPALLQGLRCSTHLEGTRRGMPAEQAMVHSRTLDRSA